MKNLKDGTYLKLGKELKQVQTKEGFWVATRQVEDYQIEDGQLFGVWVGPNNRTWLDLVEFIESKEFAINYGRANNQLAIYDNQAEDTLYLLPDGTNVYGKDLPEEEGH